MKTNPRQINLFDDFEISKEPEVSYWKEHFNWEPQVNNLATINTTIAFCEKINDKRYCYCMRVLVISIENDIAIVETTKDWEEATKGRDTTNAFGVKWHVPVKDLGPILK